ncbi:MAG TPA: hypothetical protein VF507_08170 [Pyrinomonadaceae bacterium]|jgi:hypothetical protein
MSGKVFALLLASLCLALAACEKPGASQPSAASSSPAASSQPSPVITTSSANENEQAASNANANSSNGGPSDKSKRDACALLTKEEVGTVEGDTIKETKSSGNAGGGFLVSQCFYAANDFSKSVSLALTQTDPTNPQKRQPKEFWEQTFRRGPEEEREKDKEKDKDKGKGKEKERAREAERGRERGEENEEKVPPKKVAGLGDEAFWTASRVGGALYVLKGNAFIRISVGGPGTDADKLNRSKALAQKALRRM